MRMIRLLAALALLTPFQALAQVNPCPLGNIIPCGAGGAIGATAFLSGDIVPQLKIAFGGVLLFFMVYYAARLILESGDESASSEVKQAYGHAFTGAVFVSVAALIVEGVGRSASGTLINSEAGGPLQEIFVLVITYGKWLMGTLVMVFIAVQGTRLVLLSNQESELDKQKGRFFYGLVGVAVVLLANSVVSAIVGNTPALLGEQGKAIANFLLEVFGVLVVVSFIVSGLFLVFSANEGLKDRAKKAFYASVIGVVVVFSAYVIVSYVLSV